MFIILLNLISPVLTHLYLKPIGIASIEQKNISERFCANYRVIIEDFKSFPITQLIKERCEKSANKNGASRMAMIGLISSSLPKFNEEARSFPSSKISVTTLDQLITIWRIDEEKIVEDFNLEKQYARDAISEMTFELSCRYISQVYVKICGSKNPSRIYGKIYESNMPSAPPFYRVITKNHVYSMLQCEKGISMWKCYFNSSPKINSFIVKNGTKSDPQTTKAIIQLQEHYLRKIKNNEKTKIIAIISLILTFLGLLSISIFHCFYRQKKNRKRENNTKDSRPADLKDELEKRIERLEQTPGIFIEC